MKPEVKRAPWLWSLILVISGIVLLLDNLLLIDFDAGAYWPIVLVLLGVQILLRGDIGFSWQAHTFGITRGSIESASIEIESGEIDVRLRALRKPGRLIAGQYTARSRPDLSVRNNRAHLQMRRGKTWWLSLADWDVGLAQDLPWDILISGYLGMLDADLSGLDVENTTIASGLGDVRVTCPEQSNSTISARSTLGDVYLAIPNTSHAIITVKAGPFARVYVNSERFDRIEPNLYVTADHDIPENEHYTPATLTITASTVFGSIHIT
ncbi:MAG: hypothetical protein JW966_10245 [Anaerolineae bacterium]|nr:hypothetical protein [Anaerolineae bacterium]